MWNGKFWVLRKSSSQLTERPLPAARPAATELRSDRRGFRFGGVVAAAVVGVVLGHVHLTLPPAGSVESALSEMAVANQLWGLFTFGCVVVILSLGRQGIDVLLLRAMVVGFVLGAAFLGVTPLLIMPSLLWLLAVSVSALISAVLVGPVLAVLAVLANLLWYRSFTSLRPQLRIFNGGRRTAGEPRR